MENAYIKINGKEIEIPNRLTFGQIVKTEQLGLNLDDIEKKLFSNIAIIYSVIAKCSLETATNDLDQYFQDGGDFNYLSNALLNSFTNFFTRATKENNQ